MALVEKRSQLLAVLLVHTSQMIGDLGEAGHGDLDITLGILIDVSKYSLELVAEILVYNASDYHHHSR